MADKMMDSPVCGGRIKPLISQFALLFLLVAPLVPERAFAESHFCDWYNQSSGAARSVPCFTPDGWGGTRTTTVEECEAARKQAKYQKCRTESSPAPGPTAQAPAPQPQRSSGPASPPPPAGAPPCQSSSGCLDQASRTDGMGIDQLSSLSGDMGEEQKRLHDLQAKYLSAASASAETWTKNVTTEQSLQMGGPDGLSHDRSVLAKAYDSYNGKGDFNAGDASAAVDPAIRNQLLRYADAHAGETSAHLDWQSAQKAMDSLRSKKAEALARKNGLDNSSGNGASSLVNGAQGGQYDRGASAAGYGRFGRGGDRARADGAGGESNVSSGEALTIGGWRGERSSPSELAKGLGTATDGADPNGSAPPAAGAVDRSFEMLGNLFDSVAGKRIAGSGAIAGGARKPGSTRLINPLDLVSGAQRAGDEAAIDVPLFVRVTGGIRRAERAGAVGRISARPPT